MKQYSQLAIMASPTKPEHVVRKAEFDETLTAILDAIQKLSPGREQTTRNPISCQFFSAQEMFERMSLERTLEVSSRAKLSYRDIELAEKPLALLMPIAYQWRASASAAYTTAVGMIQVLFPEIPSEYSGLLSANHLFSWYKRNNVPTSLRTTVDVYDPEKMLLQLSVYDLRQSGSPNLLGQLAQPTATSSPCLILHENG